MTSVKKFINKIGVRAWITIFATSALGIEMWLILSAAWDIIGYEGQVILVVITFIIVLAFGYGKNVTPQGFLTRKREGKRRVK